jgi:predicted nucleic acid-binding protein
MNVEFVDTNILVDADADPAGPGHKRSSELITDIWERGVGALRVQVLAEFYSTVTRKLKMTAERAEDVIRPLGVWMIHRPGHADLLSAISLQRQDQLSWWDAMILWTEDLQHGQRFGHLVVQNPFV